MHSIFPRGHGARPFNITCSAWRRWCAEGPVPPKSWLIDIQVPWLCMEVAEIFITYCIHRSNKPSSQEAKKKEVDIISTYRAGMELPGSLQFIHQGLDPPEKLMLYRLSCRTSNCLLHTQTKLSSISLTLTCMGSRRLQEHGDLPNNLPAAKSPTTSSSPWYTLLFQLPHVTRASTRKNFTFIFLNR